MDFSGFKYLSFDCYGTLVDWENGILDALSGPFSDYRKVDPVEVLQAFAHHEAEVEAGEFLTYREVLTQVYSRICRQFGIDDSNQRRLADSVACWVPFPDTKPALAKLSERFKLVILSNVDEQMFARTEKSLGVPFFRVCTAERIGSYKPCPENFRFLIEELGGDRSTILHAAQSLFHDHVPARRSGLKTVWVNRASRLEGLGATPPAEAEPDFEVTSMSELAELVLS
ncbi:MAG: haloacid dehalogenase type II [Planctomycetota bacterium]|nr:haloacid dehalogenase type II [Planctomycetota bacterium]